MISLDKVAVEFGGIPLFKDVSVLINKKEKTGLVGLNGAGKSTILKLFTGEMQPSEGSVVVPSDISMGYLPQHLNFSDTTSVYAETLKAFDHITDLEKDIERLNVSLADRTDYDSSEYLKIIDRLSDKTERLSLLKNDRIEAQTERTLTGLGFIQEDFDRPTSEFSGGWRMRIELAKILLQSPSVLLLDEPTNHLDIESIFWLENFLNNYFGALILISHDRTFLDNVTTRTLEISLGKLNDYRVPYSKFVELKAERREQQLAAYRNQQKQIEDTKVFIERFRYKNTKAVQVQSRIKMLEKMELVEIEEEDMKKVKIRFSEVPRSGKIIFEAESLSKSYGQHEVLKNIGIILERGNKIAFVGKNGEGKTTLARVIVGEISDFKGTRRMGHNVSIGYYAQNQENFLDPEKTVLQTIDDEAVGDIRSKVRDILGAFLFSGDDIYKKVKVLSGGEKSRLALSLLLLKPYNFLVLDEPTNHLDMRTKDILKNALQHYAGTLLVISHDRYFLDGLVDVVYEFRNRKVHQHIGGIFDFLAKKNISTLQILEASGNKEIISEGKMTSENKQKYLERKEFDRKLRKAESAVKKSEKQIEEYETKLKTLDEKISEGDIDGQEIFTNYERLKNELWKEMIRWETLHTKLEKLMDQKQ